MRLRYTDRARDDIEIAFAWYERQRRGLGLEFLDPEFNLKVQHPEAEGNRVTMRGLCRNNTAIYQYMTET